MTPSLNVIALVSGGKDSFYSILHCQANGHNVIALANLQPPAATNSDEDIDSYMYQTVGHAVIPLYERALGIPLYRREITGKAVNSNRDYAIPSQKQEQDETEDLVPLLRRVMQEHPEANAVSTGAILSTYQRTRVESVALRLGLTPLSYLWQYPLLPPYTQSSLLHDMSAVGQKAVIIKTASGGLDEEFLGLDVAAQRTVARLGKVMSRFGQADNGAILGEGGEFETLALDGPSSLWQKRIRLDNGPPAVLEGGQTVARITNSTLEEKSEDAEGPAGALRIPELFDEEFKKVLDLTEDNDGRSVFSDDATLVNEPMILPEDVTVSEGLAKNSTSDSPTVFTYANLTSDIRPTSDPGLPSRQLIKIFHRLDHVLKQWQLSKTGINHCTLLLRDMADFTVLNPVYAQYFCEVNPPARVTIAVGDTMSQDVDVMLSVIVDKDEKDRKGKVVRSVERQGLHVQGRSYWAPANIGPYSQSISVRLPPDEVKNDDNESTEAGEIIYVAGQIPLLPASMAVYQPHNFRGQVLLSLQHLWRIGRTKGVRWWTAGVGFIPASPDPEEHVRTAQAAWKAIHAQAFTSASFTSDTGEDDKDSGDENEQEPHIDPWDRLNRHTAPSFNDTTHRSPIPDPSAISSPTPQPSNGPLIPPCFIAQVSSLPRAVSIEWSATGLSHAHIDYLPSAAASSSPSSSSSSSSSSWSSPPAITLTHPRSTLSRFYTLELRCPSDIEHLRRLGDNSFKDWTCATLYAGRGCQGDVKMNLRGVQWVPCQRVWGEGGREVRGVIVGRVDRETRRGGEEGGIMGKFVSGLRFKSM
ncbi:hypothetical protein ACN47E_001163 [Coniothyrium glycines]